MLTGLAIAGAVILAGGLTCLIAATVSAQRTAAGLTASQLLYSRHVSVKNNH